MKRIGILGGISHESTTQYYEIIHKKYFKKYKDYYYPEIVVFSLNFQKFTDFENSSKKNYIKYIMKGITSLEKAGAEFIVMAANSPHIVFEDVEKRSKVPLLSIVKVTAEKARKECMKKLLLLGIRVTMQSSFYQNVCKKYGITVVTPSPNEQNKINRIIFDELVIGIVTEESKKNLLKIINNYKVDGVILGCTELPLLLNQEDVDVPLLNTLELHAEAALDYALL
ncbi:MAG: amino acid racemase [Theionarchaea archaeon]|nr:MAG: aspartate racemase [Theionarchaea archaeon DG-70-1]MBU7026829.1 amino acid racemase [Theionarchaea archaeon]